MKTYSPGVYYDIPEEEYHAIPALGSTGLSKLLISPLDYWDACIANTSSDSVSKVYGSASHKYVLEGKEAFDAIYLPYPKDGEYLRIGSEIEGAIRLHGETPKGVKAKKIEQLLRLCPDAKIWDHYVESMESSGKHLIKDYDDIVMRSERARQQFPHLIDGIKPEVTLLWNDPVHGFLCKARLDGYKPDSHTLELKTFANSRGYRLNKAIASSIASYGYHFQQVWYETGKVENRIDVPHKMLFLRTDLSKPQYVEAELPKENADSCYLDTAFHHIRNACDVYASMLQKYGFAPEVPWDEPLPKLTVTDQDMPVWIND